MQDAQASIGFQDRPHIIVLLYDLFAAGPVPNLQDYSITAAAILQVMGSTARWEPSAHAWQLSHEAGDETASILTLSPSGGDMSIEANKAIVRRFFEEFWSDRKMFVFRIADGKIVESWATWDRLGLLERLGGIAKPA